MATIGNLAVNVTANTEKFSRGLKSARKELSLFDKGAAAAVQSVRSAMLGLGAAFAASFTIRSIGDTISKLDDLADSATRLGASAQKLGGLMHAAFMSDVSGESLVKALTIMEKNVANGSKAFRAMGLDVGRLKQLEATEMFVQIADAINRMPTAAEQTAAAMAAFGKNGAAMLELVSKGRTGIELAMSEAESMGLAPSDADLEQIAKADRAIKQLTESYRGLKQEIAIKAAGPGAATLDFFNWFLLNGKAPAARDWDEVIGSMPAKDFSKMSGQMESASKAPLLQRLFLEKQIAESFGIKGGFLGGDGSFLNPGFSFAKEAIARRSALGVSPGGGPAGIAEGPAGGSMFGGTPFGPMALGMMTQQVVELARTFATEADKQFEQDWAAMGSPEFARISNNIDEMIAASRGTTAPAARRAQDYQIQGNAALEQGTAAAFSASSRSSQTNSLLDVNKKTLKQNEIQTKALLRIDTNLKTTKTPVTVNIA